jgi:hypothetical protein
LSPVRAAIPARWKNHLRLETAQQRLAVAFALSLFVHAAGFITWKVAPATASILRSALARLAPVPQPTVQQPKQPAPVVRPPQREVPLVFVEVDPALAAAEPPKDTKNYSTHNSHAANPEPNRAEVPKIDGSQTRVLRTTDNPRPTAKPLEPAPPPEPKPVLKPEQSVVEKPQEKPPEKTPETLPAEPEKKPIAAGDYALLKRPEPVEPKSGATARNSTAEPPRQKPRTVREAMARNPALAGNKTQQDGGVQRRGHIALDAKGSPFGNYDSVFIGIVQERWYTLLDQNRFTLDRRGKVAVTFKLHYDGRITALGVEENTVGPVLGLLCEKAILDPAPFPKWPTEMRQRVGEDTREVRFTFYYD